VVNGAVDIERGPGQPPQIPNSSQGFGLVNMQSSIATVTAQTDPLGTRRPWGGFWDAKTAAAGGTPVDSIMRPVTLANSSTLTIDIPPFRELYPGGDLIAYTLKVTLVWTDRGGINLLDRLGLAVTLVPPPPVNGGPALLSQRRHGNKGAADQMGTPDNYDDTNNVQQVLWEEMPEGKASISVRCMCSGSANAEVAYAIAWSLD